MLVLGIKVTLKKNRSGKQSQISLSIQVRWGLKKSTELCSMVTIKDLSKRVSVGQLKFDAQLKGIEKKL